MPSRWTSVFGLLCHRGPSTVRWFVIAVVVYALNCVRWRWGQPHVCEESLKTGRPSLTNRNAPAAVVSIGDMRCQPASIPHSAPSVENAGVGRSMRCGPDGGKLFSEAAARIGFSLAKVLTRNDGFRAAFATATEDRSNPADSVESNNNVSSECRSGQINYFSTHMNHLIILSILAVFLSGCASCPVPSVPEPPPANLRQPCRDLTAPADGTGGAVLRWSVDLAKAYRDCQSRQRGLVEAWPK